jgi:hypothetical protein
LKLSDENKSEKLENLIKLNLLDGCVRQYHPDKLCLIDLQKKDKFFYNKLEESIKKLSEFKRPRSISISNQDQEILDQKLLDFLN